MSAFDKLNEYYNESVANAKLKADVFGKMYSQQAEGVGKVLGLLDRPLNAAQGLASGEEDGLMRGLRGEVDYSYMDAIPLETQAAYPRATAAAATLGEFVADPVNLVGAGLVKKGTDAANKLKNYDIKGLVSSSFPNFLDDFYGLKGTRFEEIPTREKLLGEVLGAAKVKGASTTEEGTAIVAKARGFVNGMADGIKNIAGIAISPEARALWAEQGINQGAVKIIEERLSKSLTDSGFDLTSAEGKKAVAQAQFHILALVRAGRQDAIPEALKRISDVSFLGGFVPYTKDAYKRVINKHARITNADTGRKIAVPEKRLDQAMDYIAKAWDLPLDNPMVSLSVKRAQGSGGAHVTDAAFKNPALSEIRQAFTRIDNQKGSVTNEKLFQELSNRLSAKSTKGEGVKTEAQKRFTLLTKSAEDAKENGIWVMSSGRSVSYLEGGINFLTHIDKKGRATVFVSDEQNFLEKAPIVNKFIEGKRGDQPVRSLTVSEPIAVDVIKKMNIKANSGARPTLMMTDPNKPRTERMLQNEDFAGLLTSKAGPEMLAAMKTKMAGEGLLGANTYQKLTSDEEQ